MKHRLCLASHRAGAACIAFSSLRYLETPVYIKTPDPGRCLSLWKTRRIKDSAARINRVLIYSSSSRHSGHSPTSTYFWNVSLKGPQRGPLYPAINLSWCLSASTSPSPNEVSHKTVIRPRKGVWGRGGAGGFEDENEKLCRLMYIIIRDSSQAALSKYTESS